MSNIPSMQDLLEAGVHFGHQVRRGHPKMGEYVFGVRDGVHIINLEYSEKLLKEAAEFAEKLGAEGKVLLFVGTKKQAQPIIEEAAKKAEAPFVNDRWMGGTLTNFDEIKRNVRKLSDLAVKKEKGELSHYTKKEQLLIARKLEKFDRVWGGVEKLEKLPDAIFLADCVGEKTALAESIRMGLPVIGIADSNSNPQLLNYPIPGNDDATKSIKILVDTIANAYAEGLKKAKNTADKAKADAEKKEQKANAKGEVGDVVMDEVAVAEEILEKAAVQDSERKV